MSAAISNLTVSSQVSTAPTPSTSPKTLLQQYLKERRPEVRQLAEALKAGDLAGAEQAYNNLVALGNKVLGKDNPFLLANRALDFNAIGGALQNGDLTGARQAFRALADTFVQRDPPAGGNTSVVSPDTVVKLSNGQSG
jgi:hypothetical protein